MITHHIELDPLFFSSFRKGDEKVFEFVFSQYYSQIVAFCHSFVNDRSIAENISQEAFIHLWLNRKKINKPAGIRAFLYTVAKSRCLNYLRDQKRQEQFLSTSPDSQEADLNIRILDSFDFNAYNYKELEDLVREVIDGLPVRCREVFMKSRFEGKKNREIADELGITLQAVEANISRAIKKLRVHLSDYLPVLIIEAILKIF